MRIWCYCLLLILSTTVSAETLLLPYGTETNQLGSYVDGDYLRGPFGASLGSDGTIWVADSYKARVAKFSRAGVYQSEIPLEAISPRMTFFQKRTCGFVTLADQTISVWKEDGTIVVQAPLGLALPEAVWASERNVFAQFSEGTGGYCEAWDDTGAMTRTSLRQAGIEVAAIEDGRPWMPLWAEQKALFGWKAPVADDALLAGWTDDGRSVWVRRTERAQAWWVGADGSTAGAPVEFANVRGEGTSLSVSSRLDLVVSRWTKQALEIEIFKGP